MSSPISSSLGRTERNPEQSKVALERSLATRIWWCGRAMQSRMLWVLLGAVLMTMIAGRSRALAEDLNDYPTSARADYVFGCMKANGETREILQKCSCSIDVIASIIPYDRYVATETILSMSQVTGPVGNEFRATEPARLELQQFRQAQAEAEIRCF